MSANFCSSESEFQSEKELSVGEKREASVLAPYEIPAKHLEHLHAWLLPIITAFIVDTVAGCYSGGQALALNAVTPTCLCHILTKKRANVFKDSLGL